MKPSLHVAFKPLMQNKLIMTMSMEKCLAILQMPILELCTFLEKEIESNPVIEPCYSSVSKKSIHDLVEIEEKPSLFEKLMAQARSAFTGKKQLQIAEKIIGSLDEKGRLCIEITAEEEQAVLKTIQTFTPNGMGAKDVREALLIGLRNEQKTETLAYRIARDHFSLLLKMRLEKIQKKERCSLLEIQQAIKELSRFNIFTNYKNPLATQITPDFFIRSFEGNYFVETQNHFLPQITINSFYQENLYSQDSSVRSWTKKHVNEAFFLKRGIEKRNQLLLKLGQILIKTQKAFFEFSGDIQPLLVKEVSEKLKIHQSTLFRALASKYVSCPRGMFLLRSFFERADRNKQRKKTSHLVILELLRELIANENKSQPFTDEEIAKKLSKQAYPLARRTVAKYRSKNKIPSANLRKAQYLIWKKSDPSSDSL